MSSEKTVQVDGVGKVVFVKSHKARNLSIRLRAFHPVIITIPTYVSFEEGEKFLQQKKKWIIKTLQKTQQLEQGLTIFKKDTEFRTHDHVLEMNPEERKNINIYVGEGKIRISYPAQVDPSHLLVQKCARRGIEEAWRIEAEKRLSPLLQELAQKYGFRFNRVSIRNSRTHWGSCSSENNISLSLHLVRLPQHLIEFVLLHELVHTVHKNHSAKYHAELRRILPEEALLSRELAKFSIAIY